MLSLLMRRPDLRDLPPRSAEIQPATAEDAAELAQLLHASFDEAWDAGRVREVLLEDPSVEEVYLLRSGERVVATASARLLPQDYPGTGYLHWVASHPDLRGHGLGLAVTLAVLHRFADDGLDATVLETDDERLAAIKLYLGLGYVPQYRDSTHEGRWSGIFRNLARAGNPQPSAAGQRP